MISHTLPREADDMLFGVYFGTGIHAQYFTSPILMRAADHHATYFGERVRIIAGLLHRTVLRKGWRDLLYSMCAGAQ
jgi:hypothetical protein